MTPENDCSILTRGVELGEAVTTPERTTAAAYPRHLKGQVVADSMALRWPGLFVRRYKFPRVVDRFLVPATPKPLIACQIKGSAVFKERDVGGIWLTHSYSTAISLSPGRGLRMR